MCIRDRVTALEALGESFNLPYIEVDMLDIDKEYLKKFSYAFMKKHKFLPVSVQKSGTLLLAVGRPLDYYALSAVATVHTLSLIHIFSRIGCFGAIPRLRSRPDEDVYKRQA